MDREKKIAEIREWHEGKRDSFPQFTVFEAFGVMLDELDRIQQEYAEERAAHNAHVTELCELEKENRKLRQERDTIYADWNKEKDKQIELTYELLSAQQEIERLREHVSRAWKACWKVAGDDTKLEQKLIECLQWYADTQNYKYPTVGGAGAKRPIDYDRGERARDILKEIGVMVE